ncbi:MAG: terminase family protein [Sphingopyxis sp.]
MPPLYVTRQRATMPPEDASLCQLIEAIPPDKMEGYAAEYAEALTWLADHPWLAQARVSQREPAGDWRLWLMMAGRGFGKTRAGAEWVDAQARANPGLRIALVGASHDDVRGVMIEGASGIMNLPGSSPRPIYQPALRRIIWPGGAMATCYSAAEPEALRGPQQHIAWADEVARWGASIGDDGRRGVAAWDNLMMGMRLGAIPRVLATTTPRAVPLMRQILKSGDMVVSGGPSCANADNLPASFIAAMEANYGGTMLGRQEIGGDMIDDVEGALWTREGLEMCRVDASMLDEEAFARVVIGVDPPASKGGDACGIVVCALLSAPLGSARMAVIADESVEHATPERWASAVAKAATRWRADRVVAEANNGGEMVRSVLHAVNGELPVVMVHASRSKAARAEPIAIHYSAGRVCHIGSFARLEDQMCALMAGGRYAGPGRSPDRADAMVWALHALMDSGSDGPRVRGL